MKIYLKELQAKKVSNGPPLIMLKAHAKMVTDQPRKSVQTESMDFPKDKVLGKN
jgi:hypothetical protein